VVFGRAQAVERALRCGYDATTITSAQVSGYVVA
jgi:hypothetical protein